MSRTTNITVNVINFQPAYTSLGLGPIPAGTTPDDAVATLQKKLGKDLQTNWPSTFEPYNSMQEDSGVMAPWKANIPGTAPKCATDAIALDFEAWGLPVDHPSITLIAKEVTQQISNHGGNMGVFYGKSRIAGSTTIQWGVSFTTSVVVDKPEEMGIIFAFAAVLAI